MSVEAEKSLFCADLFWFYSHLKLENFIDALEDAKKAYELGKESCTWPGILDRSWIGFFSLF